MSRSRIDKQPEALELIAAKALSNLAEEIENAVYYCRSPKVDGLYAGRAQAIPPATIHELNRCYRVLKRACVFNSGKDCSLVYEPPDGKFRRAAK